MNTARHVTAVAPIPFRLFLPHEKPASPKPVSAKPRRPAQSHEIIEEEDMHARERPLLQRLHQRLSDEDLGVLLEARLQTPPLPPKAGGRAGGYTVKVAPYLPFAFALAARGQTSGV